MSVPTVSFVIPVRNDAARLERCLRSILANGTSVPFEIVVADNGSTDNSADVAARAGATVISLPDRAVSEVRNDAVRRTRAPLLAFVDADQELAPGWLAAAAGLFGSPSVWAAGADYHAPGDGTWVQRVYDRFRSHTAGPVPVDWLPSGNLVVRRTAFDRIAGFDTTLESCEDVDFCRRIREAGGTLVESAALRSIHHGDPRTLRALFLSELWRGRDNLRVSLRERLTLRSAPSVVIPVAYLLALAALVSGLVVLLAGGGVTLAVAGGAVAFGLTTLRALRLSLRRVPGEDHLTILFRAWPVAATYDVARALALVTRASHDVRRKG